MNDPAAHKNPNVRKPTLKVVLERLDGSQVDDNRFADIQSSVRAACCRFLDLSTSYTKQTPSAQDAYIGYAESLAPELSYCDETGWKAVMMARTFIDGKTRRGRDSAGPNAGKGRKGKRKEGTGSPSDEPTPAKEGPDETEQQSGNHEQDAQGNLNKRRRTTAGGTHQRETSPEDFPVVSLLTL